MGMGFNKIVFPTYKKEEPTELFKYTVGFDSINFKTVEFVAAKVSHSSGDARAFFTTMDRTIDATIHCLDDNGTSSLFSPYWPDIDKPLTSIHDEMQVFMTDSPQFKNDILSLP
jgi:hypothetical protein